MKRALTVVLVLVIALCSVFAGDFKFLFTELDQHTEILAGFLPTLVTIGAGYEGLELSEGDLTQIQVTLGGGYTQRALYQAPYDNFKGIYKQGEPLRSDIMLYDCMQLRWNVKFLQGFGSSWVEGKDLITAYIGYEGRYERGVDSMVKGQDRLRGYPTYNPSVPNNDPGTSTIESLDAWFGSSKANNPIYPDLADDYRAFMTNFYLGAKINLMEDLMVSNEGLTAEIKLQVAPGILNKKASYYSLTFNLVGGTTLFELHDKKGLNIVSLVAIDRFNANWTDGNKVPVYAQMPVSLGRKVRGFNTNSYNTNFTIVNNLDLRFAGPEFLLDGIFPRLNLFFDMGYYAGEYFNTNINSKNMAQKYDIKTFLCSAGFQLEMCFFDFIDLGFQMAYLINGENMRNPGKRWIAGATFFLDF